MVKSEAEVYCQESGLASKGRLLLHYEYTHTCLKDAARITTLGKRRGEPCSIKAKVEQHVGHMGLTSIAGSPT